MKEIGEVAAIPMEYDIEWKIDDFASLSGIYYYSKSFDFEDLLWNFGIQPNGSPYTSTENCIDFYLYRRSTNGPTINVEFYFSLKNIHGKKVLKKCFEGTFEGFCAYPVQRFFLRKDFDARQTEFLSSSALTIICTIRKLKSDETESEIVTAECLYCEDIFNVEKISFHEKKCCIKCLDCNNFVINKNWHDHECQIARVQDESG